MIKVLKTLQHPQAVFFTLQLQLYYGESVQQMPEKDVYIGEFKATEDYY